MCTTVGCTHEKRTAQIAATQFPHIASASMRKRAYAFLPLVKMHTPTRNMRIFNCVAKIFYHFIVRMSIFVKQMTIN